MTGASVGWEATAKFESSGMEGYCFLLPDDVASGGICNIGTVTLVGLAGNPLIAGGEVSGAGFATGIISVLECRDVLLEFSPSPNSSSTADREDAGGKESVDS